MGLLRGSYESHLPVSDLDRMRAFYRDVVGLAIRADFDSEVDDDPLDGPPRKAVFFRVGPGDVRPQLLALFDRSADPEFSPPEQAASTLDHLAFEIPSSAFQDERQRLETLGVDVEVGGFGSGSSPVL